MSETLYLNYSSSDGGTYLYTDLQIKEMFEKKQIPYNSYPDRKVLNFKQLLLLQLVRAINKETKEFDKFVLLHGDFQEEVLETRNDYDFNIFTSSDKKFLEILNIQDNILDKIIGI